MVTSEDIERVSKLMKIEIDDHAEYVDKVRTMIDYFDILDSADVGSEEISMPEVPFSHLREDRHVPFGGRIADHLKCDGEAYVRAPRMSS